MVFGKTVTIKFAKTDRDKREPGKVLLGALDANLEQVRSGLAWHFKKYQREQSPGDREAYARAEVEARYARIGRWRDPNPQPPWVLIR